MRLLLKANIIELSLDDSVHVGVFAVWKSDRIHQRLIIDARISNPYFEEPESPDLPTGASYVRVFLKRDQEAWFSCCDLKDAFYTIQLPPQLRHLFVLSPLRAKDLGIRRPFCVA